MVATPSLAGAAFAASGPWPGHPGAPTPTGDPSGSHLLPSS